MRGRRLLAAAATVAVGAAALGVTIAAGGGDEAPAAEPWPILEAPAPTSTVPPPTAAPTTTTTAPALPVPARPPADPYADVPVTEIGSIEIPAIGLDHPVYEGIWLTVLDHGPGHWPGTALPGEPGNAVFPGHRVTHSHPFLDLDRLRPGDQIVFRTASGVFTYAVTKTEIVTPKDLWVIDQTSAATVTLVACHPKHSARQRIVVQGELVRSQPAAAGKAAA